MKFKKFLGLAALAAAGSACSSAYAGLASMQITVHHNTGDAYVDGLPATKQVNLAGDVVTTVSTCTGQVRKQIVGTGTGAIITTAAFDAVGNLLSRRDATGAGTDFTYDALGRKLTETDAAIVGKVRSFTYDLANRLISATDPLGIVTTFAYDLRDRKISESTPMTGSITRLIQYGYNGRGLMTTLTDANAAVTTWAYDAAGRQVSKTYANGDHREMAYDAAGRLVTLTDENGHDITSVYDLAGRLVSKAFAADSTTDTYVYDAASRMTSVTKGRYAHTLTYAYDAVGRLATETHPDGTVITQAYDSANRLANLSLGGTSGPAVYSVDYGYDTRGLLSSVASGDYASAYDYRTNGQLLSTVHSQLATPVGDVLRTDRSYDAGARLLGVANTAANNDQAGVVYALGLDDQRTEALEESGQKWEYGYDGLKQLVTAKKTDTQAVVVSPLDQSYSYDPMGNRAAYTDTTGSTAYTANNANQYTTVGGIASTYDANGNLLSDGMKNYTWDAENQLISVTPVSPVAGSQKVEYTYDWRMRRTGKKSYTYISGAWVLAKTTGFKYHDWNPVQEIITDAVTSTVSTKTYVWGNDLSGNRRGAGGVGGLLSMRITGSSPGTLFIDGYYFYAFDGNGNVRALVKADNSNPASSAVVERYAYDGFGREISAPVAASRLSSWGFSTKQLDDETGMNYYGYRYYAAVNGRWINRDPVSEKGGVNIYQMVNANVISSVDRLGLIDFDVKDCVVTMTYSLDFLFKAPLPGVSGPAWTSERKTNFISSYKEVVAGAFNANSYKIKPKSLGCYCDCPNGLTPQLAFRPVSSIGGFFGLEDLTVHVAPGKWIDFNNPHANPHAEIGGDDGYIYEDSVNPGSSGSSVQIAAVHEFGHTLGLYHPGEGVVLYEPDRRAPYVYSGLDVNGNEVNGMVDLMGVGMGLRPFYFQRWLGGLDSSCEYEIK